MGQKSNVAIVGAGPAGIAAAIYLKRAEVNSILFEKQQPGGLLRHAFLVENYPGFPDGITGMKLTSLLVKHLKNMGVSIKKSKVTRVDYEQNSFIVQTGKKNSVFSSVIIASGTQAKKIQITGSAPFESTRLFYEPSAIPLKEKKRILVIGGGDIAFDYTMTLLERGYEVTIVSRSEPVCLPLLKKQVLEKGAVLRVGCDPQKIHKSRKELLLQCQEQKQIMDLPFDYLLVACGRKSNISFLAPRLKTLLKDQSDVPRTVLPGLYVAGDVTRGMYRQTGIAVGDGIQAAMMVQRYLEDRGGKV
jgi:thioredoxin reductase (NADPH)